MIYIDTTTLGSQKAGIIIIFILQINLKEIKVFNTGQIGN